MKKLHAVFEILYNSIDIYDLSEVFDEMNKIDAYNQKELPNWLSSVAVNPQPIVPNAIVERYGFVIPGAEPVYADVHELGGVIKYVKIFFLFDFYQFKKKSLYKQEIPKIIQAKMGNADIELTMKMQTLLDKN